MRACVTCGVAGLRVDRAVRPPPCACASSRPAAPDCLARHLLAHTCTCMRPLNCEPCAACGPPRCYPLPPPAALAEHTLLCSLRHIITQWTARITSSRPYCFTPSPQHRTRSHVTTFSRSTPSHHHVLARNHVTNPYVSAAISASSLTTLPLHRLHHPYHTTFATQTTVASKPPASPRCRLTRLHYFC